MSAVSLSGSGWSGIQSLAHAKGLQRSIETELFERLSVYFSRKFCFAGRKTFMVDLMISIILLKRMAHKIRSIFIQKKLSSYTTQQRPFGESI